LPLYVYECQTCGYRFEEVRAIHMREITSCPSCLNEARQIITAPAIHVFQPFWHEDFGDKPVFVESKAHYKQLCKQYGVYAPHVFGTSWNLSEV